MTLPVDPVVLAELAQSKAPPDASILTYFHSVPDFRREHGRRHLLVDILVIAVFATVADCDSYVEMAEYGVDNETWLRRFLSLPNGIPSHDTFRYVFCHLNPLAFQQACVNYARDAAEKLCRADQTPTSSTDSPPTDTTTQPIALTVTTTGNEVTEQASVAVVEPSPPSQPRSDSPERVSSLTPTESRTVTDSPPDHQPPQTAALPAVEDNQPEQLATLADIQATCESREAPAASVAEPLSAQASLEQAVALPDPEAQRRHLAVDGKTLRGSLDKTGHQAALHLVSVWASEERLTLAQVAVEAKSNEITAIPEVLSLVALEGAVVTIDAIGTQEAIIAQIREGKGDFVLAVKENQPHLYEDALASFGRYFERLDHQDNGNRLVVVSKGEHGRQETRSYVVIDDVSGIRNLEKWRDVKRLIMVTREVQKSDGRREEETRYFIGSAASGVAAYAKWVREHWGIENRLHWVLDVVFHEDASRVRKDHATENLGMLHRLAVGLLGNDKSCKRSIKGKRKKAARNHEFLIRVLLDLPDTDTPV